MNLDVIELDYAVVGGGFYGASLSCALASKGTRVQLFESRNRLMDRASYVNQARVHGGYHYPRSLLTASRSRALFRKFGQKYGPAVFNNFKAIYAIAGMQSIVSARQFEEFCRRIDAPIKPAGSEVLKQFDSRRVEAVFEVEEYAFNADTLRNVVLEELNAAAVPTHLGYRLVKIQPDSSGLRAYFETNSGQVEVRCKHLFLCTYSEINTTLSTMDLPLIPLQQEWVEMALVEPPRELQNCAVTVMDGPFFSLMPFPARQLWTLSHVSYTPHFRWFEERKEDLINRNNLPRESNFLRMLKDASRYVPAIAQCRYRDSLWEVKTVLPKFSTNDDRPILYKKNHGISGLHVIMGGKIDNVFDMVDQLEKDLLHEGN